VGIRLARPKSFDGPTSRFGRVQREHECSTCIVRVGREILCKVGGVFFLLWDEGDWDSDDMESGLTGIEVNPCSGF